MTKPKLVYRHSTGPDGLVTLRVTTAEVVRAAGGEYRFFKVEHMLWVTNLYEQYGVTLAAYRRCRSRVLLDVVASQFKEPVSHVKHKKYAGMEYECGCGCWTTTMGFDVPTVNCPACGATYVASETAELATWWCYDCGCEWRSEEGKK